MSDLLDGSWSTAPLLIEPETLARLLGRPEDDRMADVCEVVSGLVRGHLGLTISEAQSVVALGGTAGPLLWLPENPVRAILSLSLDGQALDASTYRAHRSGALWRSAGWAGPDSEVVVNYRHGWEFVPDELRAVTASAALRLCANPAQLDYESDGTYQARGGFSGWTVSERLVLDRFRRRVLAR